MKRMILFLLVLIVGSTAAISQTNFGFKAGANLAGQKKTFVDPISATKKTINTKALIGYHAGVFSQTKLSANLALHGEANFTIAGSRVVYLTESQILNPDGKTHYYKDEIGYFEVPLLVEYAFNKFHIGVGPGFSFKLFSRIADFEGENHNTTNYKSLDLSGNILFGAQLTKGWGIDLRYSQGLLNREREGNQYTTTGTSFTVSVLYTLK